MEPLEAMESSASKKVSVLLPVFNGEKFVAAALESVLNQTYQNFEIIVSDNCSTDSTGSILETYAQKDSRVKVSYNQSNVGYINNYNLCISRSTGDYLELFSHDDVLMPDCLETLVSGLESNPQTCLSISASDFIDENGNVIFERRPYKESGVYSGKELIAQSLNRFENPIVSPVMFRSINKDKGMDATFKLYADLDYWFKMLENSDLVYTDKVLLQYRKHDSCQTKKLIENLAFVTDFVQLAERFSKYIIDESQPEKERQAALERFVTEKLIYYMNHLINLDEYSFEPVFSEGMNDLEEEKILKSDAFNLRKVAYLMLTHNAKLKHQIQELEEQKRNLEEEFQSKIEHLNSDITALKTSTSWKITKPLRKAASALQDKD